MFDICVVIANIVILLVLWKYFRSKQKIVEEVNTQRREENRKIEEENQKLQQERDTLQRGIMSQNLLLSSLTKTNEQARLKGESLAQQAYELKEKELQLQSDERLKAAAAEYEQKMGVYKASIDAIVRQRDIEAQKLKDIENKQIAYLEAEKRKAEMTKKKEYYSLQLSPDNQNDILLLRDIQHKIAKKDAIDKVIYEVYYRPAYNALMSRLSTKDKITGIYKITSSNGQSYIGQSVDIKERLKQHIKNGLAYNPGNNLLYTTMREEKPETFTFEILEEVPREKLNERETYWIDFYKTKDYGLNSTKGGS